jgi:hypothetical protein
MTQSYGLMACFQAMPEIYFDAVTVTSAGRMTRSAIW